MHALLSTVQALEDDERPELERALVPVARDALVGRLAGDAAHDTANALFGLLGLIELIEEGDPLSRERIELLRRSAGELEAMAAPLLRFSRVDDGETTGDLAASCERAVALARVGSFVPHPPLRVACPGALLTQAILHLVVAAPADPRLELVDGAVQVAPAAEPSFDELIARRIALDHGGSLETDGSSFLLRLPPV